MSHHRGRIGLVLAGLALAGLAGHRVQRHLEGEADLREREGQQGHGGRLHARTSATARASRSPRPTPPRAASPATVVYAVNPSAGELAFHLTQTGGSASNVQFIVNSSGNYSCTQSGSSWSCNKLDQASAKDQENLFDLYTPDHWINFLKGLSLVAGLAGDKVTTSTMSVNGFT